MPRMARRTREQLAAFLQARAKRRVTLTLTSNTSSYVSFTPGKAPLKVRLQRAFLVADDHVLIALADWLAGRSKRCPGPVRAFINRPPAEAVDLARRRRRRLEPRGRHYDLARLLEEVNRAHFDGAITARITWGRRTQKRVRSRTLGSYYRGEDLIVIHPVLDQASVPAWFVAFTIYHECLHGMQAPGETPHGAAFREALRRHPDHPAAVRWERANLGLLTRGPTVAPAGRRKAAWRVGGRQPQPPASREGSPGDQLAFDF